MKVLSKIIFVLILAIATLTIGVVACNAPEATDSAADAEVNSGVAALTEHIKKLETVSFNKSTQINGLNNKIYAMEVEKVNLTLEIESLESHIKSMPGDAGYKSITQAWTVCQGQLSEALEYKDKFTVLSKTWEEHRVILTDKLNEIELAIHKVDNRTDPTTTSNLTAEKRSHFYELWDIWHDTID